MKTFESLMEEVQKPGLCHHCGGCVTFCTAINFGALTLSEDGSPKFGDREKCIECGICYMICPEIGELDYEAKKAISWQQPSGRVLGAFAARATDRQIQANATDGGVVTAILAHLHDEGRIDGAIVTRQAGLFLREPMLARTRDEITDAAGFHFDASHGMRLFSETYSTFVPSVGMLGPMAKAGARRVAFVGTPCQIKTIRKMEALQIVPTDSIAYLFGLFCSGNFIFGPPQRERLEHMGGFRWPEVRKINVKDNLMIHLENGEIRTIPLSELDFMRRYACRFCDDYAAEYADLSFGGIGAPEGWTGVIARTPLGRGVYTWAKDDGAIEEMPRAESQAAVEAIKMKAEEKSAAKKESAAKNREGLVSPA